MSARLGSDPLQVQGPGGNTSVKDGDVMWVKASGTELADAERRDIFVPVDRVAALSEAREAAGDGSCKSTVLDPTTGLRPSIETTFHAALNHAVVAHTHSVATLAHVIGPEGRDAAARKLGGLPFLMVPYAKPGLPLTREILARITPEIRIILLANHGLICCGATVEEVSGLIAEVEARLQIQPKAASAEPDKPAHDAGFHWAETGWLAREGLALIKGGSYYPDHVVFLGPGLSEHDPESDAPAILVPDVGVLVRNSATPAQLAMLKCLSDVLLRLPSNWSAEPIGPTAEAELLNWDAEKYRQALAKRT
ncbi:class II aldolase/adducin family protein [Oricola sp.]|uniref:class II aldolase/adducin family protein n=1 Tax=Oricola sp. TaxID=1979950 RepID=UPI003BAB4767